MKLINCFMSMLLTMLWAEYMRGGNVHPHRLVLKHFFIQKILRINSNIPWPVHWTSKISAPDKIKRGDRTPGLSISCFIDGRNGIEIGENVWIGPRVSLISQNHDNFFLDKYLDDNPIRIAKNSLIAANAVVLPGVVLGEHTVVAAGAVVTKSFPDGNQVIGGNPARVIKKIGTYGSEVECAE